MAAVVDAPPEEIGWLTEIKFDGYRILASVQDGTVRLLTRNGQDWTERLPAVAAAVRRLDVGAAMLDGELMALDPDGLSSFPALQAALANGRDGALFFYAFDLLHLDGWDLRPCALRDRKRLLQGLDAWQGLLRYSDHHDGDVVRMRQAACRTSGGKGLHLVVPLVAEQPWEPVWTFCKVFAETVSEADPAKYLAQVKIAERHGRILIDWLRNGLGSTAVASFCPRARTGVGVATPLAWTEVTPKLDLTAFNLRTVPERLGRLKADPWAGFDAARQPLPPARKVASKSLRPAEKATILTAKAPKPRGKW